MVLFSANYKNGPWFHLHRPPTSTKSFPTNSLIKHSTQLQLLHCALSSSSNMHLKEFKEILHHRNTPEDTQASVQKLLEHSPIHLTHDEAKFVQDGAATVQRKLSSLSTSAHLSHHQSWQKEIDDLKQKRREKHEAAHGHHSAASTTDILAASSSAAGFAPHANSFLSAKSAQHGPSRATDYDEPDADLPPPPYSEPSAPDANPDPESSSVTTETDAQQSAGSRTLAGELEAESLGFVPETDSPTANYPPQVIPSKANQSPRCSLAHAPQNPAPSSESLHSSSSAPNTLPPQLQIQRNTPYLSQRITASFPPCDSEVTIKTTSQIRDVIYRLQEEHFFDPRNIAFLPAQLEMKLKKFGVTSKKDAVGVGAGSAKPACMPDGKSFGAVEEGDNDHEDDGESEDKGYKEGDGDEGENDGENEGEDAGEGEVEGEEEYNDESYAEGNDNVGISAMGGKKL
jgi:hypothetical protein